MASAHKVMLLGEIGVGKSSLARRLVFGRFHNEYKPTIGVEVYRYDVAAVDGADATSLILWDTDGNFGDAIFRHVYLKEAAAALIVADQSRPETVDSMVRLARGFHEVLPGRCVHFILNKADLAERPGAPSIDERQLPAGYSRHPHQCTAWRRCNRSVSLDRCCDPPPWTLNPPPRRSLSTTRHSSRQANSSPRAACTASRGWTPI
jgi:small GTP-binding protein